MRKRLEERSPEKTVKLDPRPAPYTYPFSLLAAVVSRRLRPGKNDQYELAVNLTAVEILEAAKDSAKLNKTVF